MSSHFIVCPYNKNLLNRLRGKSLVIRLDNFADISRAIQDAGYSQIHIHCIQVKTDSPLSNIKFKNEWEGVPLALYIPSLGNFRNFVNQLSTLRKLSLRVYFPTDNRENYTSLRILSSLGIESAVVFNNNSLNWEILSDLMTYSLLGSVPHAKIDPFHYIKSHYRKCERTDFSAVYFENPLEYLHADTEGHIALSSEELAAGRFIPLAIDELGALSECDEYLNRLESWRDSFLNADGCACCQGWRVCLGKFSNVVSKSKECEKFFVELMDVIEQYNSLNEKKKSVWQP